MRVLFYLPLARKWMLENVIEPMIAKLSTVAEVHVMLPAVWMEGGPASVASQGTAWRRNVVWHPLEVADGDLHAFNMTVPAPEILAAATAIAPDHCLCRSASRSLPEHLPGHVQYIMEASAPPFRLPTHWISLQPQIFDHGLLPELTPEQRPALIALIAPAWREMERARPRDPSWRRRQGLPSDRKIVALPLEYDHPDNLFALHRSVRPNSALVAQLTQRTDTRLFLAITDHPLNARFVDQRELIGTIEARRDKARLLLPPAAGGDITSTLVQHADGMIVSDSKSFAAAAFFGTPLLRTSKFASGCWLRAYSDFDTFADDVVTGNASAADREDAMLWFAYYLAAQAFAPGDADVTGTEILERITGEIHPQRWADSYARMTRLQPGGRDNSKEDE